MRGIAVCVTVVWNIGVQSGVQRWQNSQAQCLLSVRTHVIDHARLDATPVGVVQKGTFRAFVI